MGTEISIKGASVNPTNGYYPINKDGSFVDGGLTNAVLALPPWISGGSLGLKFKDSLNFGNTLLEINPLDVAFTFGEAGYNAGVDVFASGGLSIYPPIGEAVIGCGISSGANGVFRASGGYGFISIGNTPSTSIGVNMFSDSVRIGSNLINGAPSNTSTPAAWTKVEDQNGVTYYLPLYQ